MHPSSLISTVTFCATLIRAQEQCRPAIQTDFKPQVFVTSDINNEPDDTMSFIRLLVHADQYNITGLVAATSIWLNESTFPEAIMETVRLYGQVVDNLNTHSAGEFPTEEYLASLVTSGPEVYGVSGIGGTLSPGGELLIRVVDGMADDSMLHCMAWGGISTIAEALSYVSRTRAELEIERFTNKLRLYAISDQDNAGPWIRANFPQIQYIVSLHGWNQYGSSTWSGISGEEFYGHAYGGPDTSLVSEEYVATNFQLGPLGSHYPDIEYIMEGDSPTFMHVMMNGANGGPYDHPEWGGWGGRYLPQDVSGQNRLYNDARDNVTGIDGQYHLSNQATIWRWRQAYQDEMSARIQWTINSEYNNGSHPPVVNVNGSCDSSPLQISVQPGQEVVLDASESYDPDGNLSARKALQFHWWQYKEPSAEPRQTLGSAAPDVNFTLSADNRTAGVVVPGAQEACYELTPVEARQKGYSIACMPMHLLVEVTGSGEPPIRRWKRAILEIEAPESLPPTGGERKRRR